MCKICLRIGLVSALITIFAYSSVFAKPTEEGLLEAWKNLQKNDPKTIVFEKAGENLYRFKTEKFPFDGKLKVLNLVIDDRMSDLEYGYIMGIVEVELVDLPEDFVNKHPYSYSMWAQDNTLYFDGESDRWLNGKEWNAKRGDLLNVPPGIFANFLYYGTTVIYLAFMAILFIILMKTHKKNKEYMNIAQKSLTLSEESNKILKRLLEKLGNKGSNSP